MDPSLRNRKQSGKCSNTSELPICKERGENDGVAFQNQDYALSPLWRILIFHNGENAENKSMFI